MTRTMVHDMLATASGISPNPRERWYSRWAALAHHDFCPWANRYVYWLKQPVGWFVVATAASLLVGAFLNPIGWSLAAGLFGILILGLGFPWLAVRGVRCELIPMCSNIHEMESTYFELKVRNRLPIPVYGLLIENYFTLPLEDSDSWGRADVGLAAVPACSEATYRLTIRPEYRGHYPTRTPEVACAFPFGIWKARKALNPLQTLTVWPMIIESKSGFEVRGRRIAHVGLGSRPSQQGEFLGVREFRRGDSLRSIHWVQTAKMDQWIVCERGGPQKRSIDFHLMTHRCSGMPREARENLAWRVRVAASMVDLAVSRQIPFRLFIDRQQRLTSQGESGRKAAWNILASIPLEGAPGLEGDLDSEFSPVSAFTSTAMIVTVRDERGASLPPHLIRVSVRSGARGPRVSQGERSHVMDIRSDLSANLGALFAEFARENSAA